MDGYRPASSLSDRDLPPLDDRPSLPSIGLSISRAASASPHSQQSVQLPGLASLTGDDKRHFRRIGAYATSAPAASGGQSPPICQNCTTSTTPLWRRDEVGSVLCNACGLFLKLHGRPRPISLKTDVIKSRNRVKTSGQAPKKKPPPHSHPDHNGLDHMRAQAGTPPIDALNHRRTSQKMSSAASERSASPLSRTGTPGLHHPSNIAPQHMFDGVTLNGHEFHSSSLPAFALHHRQPSPSASSINGAHLEPPMTYDGLANTNTSLKTRVSELEVINDLFRGRVAELEQSEQRARTDETLARDAENRLRAGLEQSQAREADLKRRIEELEAELSEYRDGPRQKKMRLSDIVDESAASTPLSTPSQSN